MVVTLSALVPAAAAGYVSSARRLESPIVPQCLANIDFAQRVSVDRSGFVCATHSYSRPAQSPHPRSRVWR